MNGHPQSNEKHCRSQHKLPNVEDTYILDPSSEIYKPKTYYKKQKRDTVVNKLLKTWVPIVISAGTLWLLGKTVVIAEKQWEEMRISTEASTSAANTAAIALQSSQIQFLQTLQQMAAQSKAMRDSADSQVASNRAWLVPDLPPQKLPKIESAIIG
jgi:hypothetical protein